MKRLNKRGFMIAGVVYSILLLFVIIVAALMTLLSNRKNILDNIKKDIIGNVSVGNVCDTEFMSKPVLSNGLIPVIIDDQGNVTETTTTDASWYNYCEHKWANAVILVNDSLGVTEDNIAGYYVWIPKFKYSFLLTPETPIKVEFTKSSDCNEIHAAFCSLDASGNERDMAGFWIGKFEISDRYKTIPNVNSLSNKNISTFYKKIKALNKSGETSIHMIKNTEWGAAAYLSQSEFGICSKTICNKSIVGNKYYEENNLNVTTGCSYESAYGDQVTGGICPEDHRWTTENGVLASTTNNVTGVYDMSGGRFEYVMGVMSNADGSIAYNTSGFDDTSFGTVPKDEYDVYPYGTVGSDTNRHIIGDATVETLDFADNKAEFVNNTYSWFMRGGKANSGTYANIWSYDSNGGRSYYANTTRVTIFGYLN